MVLSLSALLLPVAAGAAKDATVSIPKKVSFAKDVAPIFHENCVACHRPGDIAPMALRTYDEARPWAKSIARAVRDGSMPPWHAAPEHGVFANDRSLSDYEQAVILRWVKQGAPLGDAAQVPEPPHFAEGWRLGEPDLEVTFDQVELAGGGPDVFHDLVRAYELPEDRWVKAVEILPGNREVVHHVIVYVIEEGQGQPNGWLGGWAAGMDPMVFPEGTGRLLKKGSKIVADMHYHPTAEPSTDQTRLGVHLYEGEPEKELVNLWVQNAGFKIPAGAPDHEVTSSYTFRQDSVVHSLLPHMHYRGKSFTYTATYPDGRQEVLLEVPAYDFNWQTTYELAEPLEMPAGSRIDCVAHFDNSTGNAANPDPTKDVTFGNESFDEMMIGFVDYTVKEGVRPMTAEQRLVSLRTEMIGAHPGEVFAIELWDSGDGDDERLDTVLRLSSSGEGLWFIPVNGELWEAKLVDIEGDASGFTATLKAPFGAMEVEGKGAFGGSEVSGTVKFGPQLFAFEGALTN
jgi:hypothetical protein